MQRRSFLSMIGAASLTPLLPTVGASAPAAAMASGYNRYQYGLAVFHARTRIELNAADLIAKLRVNPAQARAMMGEMSASGVLTRGASGAVTLSQNRITAKPYVRKALRQITDSACDAPIEQTAETQPDGSQTGVQP
ncbi:hypothetical protein SAMN04488040_3003 [Sulfitobacter marinus]|uniref:Uncharacterized protein n=1 Tax=Sulfitobacter marinus TaxID=394264 RepID=A0A1I6V133_9RHOB|nr:hypothetical protein [Sulfitobacter marinus]SFT07306.1 hypothetical protein SAMN04488040_3003 [Sulfitobacter marinus]